MEDFEKADQTFNQRPLIKVSKTVLTEYNIIRLREMFSDRDIYDEHLQTISTLRKLIFENIKMHIPNGRDVPDMSHEQWPIFNLLNTLYNAITQEHYQFTNESTIHKY